MKNNEKGKVASVASPISRQHSGNDRKPKPLHRMDTDNSEGLLRSNSEQTEMMSPPKAETNPNVEEEKVRRIVD